MTIREQYEAFERATLSPRAALSENAERDFPITPCDIRADYRRDCDRIVHCKAFRRLKHKTQVFLSPEGDHYRTRMTHTLEVTQIARTLARAMRLNEDLTEAVAMGHDLGHTPFGHAGEAALNEVCPLGYVHAEQSVRVVERLENGGRGLNLTKAVRNGIACHSGGTPADTLEGRIVRYADHIAYMNHDIEDAISAGILRESDIPDSIVSVIGHSKSERITTFVLSLIENSGDDIRMDAAVYEQYCALKDFLFERVYRNARAKGEEGKARELVKTLYRYFMAHQDCLSDEYRAIAEAEGPERAVCDYIGGMTDRYAVRLYEELFVPRGWNG